VIDGSTSLSARARRDIVRQVRGLFDDGTRREEPVVRSDNALFPPDSIVWRVHGDITVMMIGGVSALLLQMLHPAVLAGVWDHSNFRADLLGRLRRTARFIAVTTYGDRTEAEAAIARVRDVHRRIAGTLRNGTPYRADDPGLLAWVHLTEAWSFLAAWQLYGARRLPPAHQDRYFSEFATIGTALGAGAVPHDKAAVADALDRMRPHLLADHRTRDVARLVLGHMPANPLAIPLQRVTMQAAVDLLPAWARRMHGLVASPPLVRPLVSMGALGVARTLRWAFAGV
jgi:uncharacterized protein (DUF2236 family)